MMYFLYSSTLGNQSLMLNAKGDNLDLSQFGDNNQWDVVGKDVVMGNRLGASNIKFHLNLSRKPFYFMMNYGAPIVLLSLMSLIVFWLPPSTNEKFAICAVMFLTFIVFGVLVNSVLPASSETTPLLGT